MDAYATRREFYPPIEPYTHGMLRADETHELYWEQSGNPDGVPVIFLHGGPGGGTNGLHRRFFDPDHYRIILFDQRGCGRSKPFANITDNTTGHLVDDIETLRRHLQIESWIVFGGSWGSTLAIAYGLAHPAHCLAFVIRGIFLGRAKELDWFLGNMQTIFPEALEAFRGFLPEAERNDVLVNYHRRLTDEDSNVHLPAANAWNRFESACSLLVPRESSGSMGVAGLALARIEAHYFINNMFLANTPLLERIDLLGDIPATIVQGRYDMVCPMISAYELSQVWTNSSLNVIADAGHSAMEPGIRSALIDAMDGFRSLKP